MRISMLLHFNAQSFHLFTELGVVNFAQAAGQPTHSKIVETAVLLKYLSKFWRSLETALP